MTKGGAGPQAGYAVGASTCAGCSRAPGAVSAILQLRAAFEFDRSRVLKKRHVK